MTMDERSRAGFDTFSDRTIVFRSELRLVTLLGSYDEYDHFLLKKNNIEGEDRNEIDRYQWEVLQLFLG